MVHDRVGYITNELEYVTRTLTFHYIYKHNETLKFESRIQVQYSRLPLPYIAFQNSELLVLILNLAEFKIVELLVEMEHISKELTRYS